MVGVPFSCIDTLDTFLAEEKALALRK